MATRERILDGAARVLVEYGYTRGTTNRMAEEAGLSVGSLYQYFPNKDAVLAELLRRHVADGVAAVQAAVADGPLDVPSVLRRAVAAMVEQHRTDQRLHQVLFEEAPRPVDVLEELRTGEEALVSALAVLLAADAQVQVADVDTSARLVAWTAESVVHRAAAAGRLDDEGLEQALLSMLLSHLYA